MIRAIGKAFDNLFGRGDAAVTVPPLDGALRPNRLLDETGTRTPFADVDCLARHGGDLVASAGDSVFVQEAGGGWTRRRSYGSAVVGLAAVGTDGLAVALDSGYVVVEGGRHDGRRYRADPAVTCITAMAVSGDTLFLANGSATHPVDDWQRDLLEGNASGSVWRIDLDGGSGTRIAAGLAWPAGLAVDGDGLVVSEAWRHQLVRIGLAGQGRPRVLHADLPGYPGRISPAADGHWLAIFAPRSQLVEFVLREPAYRKRMMAEVPKPFWVVPKLRAGRSYYEPLQGGGVKHLGLLKPWAPTMSAGLCVRLDPAFQPRSSLQSRADGRTHGVTSVAEHGGQLVVAARGDGVVVAMPVPPAASRRGGRA